MYKKSKVVSVKKYNPTAEKATKALRIAQRVQKAVKKSELKFYDSPPSVFTSAVNSTGAVYPLCNIPSGTGPSSRIGNKALLKSVLAKFTFQQSTLGNASGIRVILFIDKAGNNGSGTPLVTDLLQNGTYSFISPLNTINANRFRILHDKTYSIGSNGPQEVIKSLYSKVNQTMGFIGSALTSYDDGQPYLLVCSDTITNNPTMYMYCRVRFTDM